MERFEKSSASEKTQQGKQRRPGTLLVVHGDGEQRDPVDRHLTARGHNVFTAENGDEALEMMEACPPDLVLLGPNGAGPRAADWLKRLQDHDLLHGTPILMIPTADEVDEAVVCMENGAADILTLPAAPALLHKKVETLLDLRRLRNLENAYLERMDEDRRQADELVNVVVPASVALSAEKDFTRLLERILLEAKGLCNADGGTIYLRNESDQLEFMMFHNDSMGIRLGGTTGQPVRFPPLNLHDPVTGEPNHANHATFAALSGEILNIPDARDSALFDFSGSRRFDEAYGYRSTSFLTLPLRNASQTLGVLQLINAQDRETGEVIPFSQEHEQLMDSFSLLATVAIDSYTRAQGLRQELQHLRAELERARRTT